MGSQRQLCKVLRVYKLTQGANLTAAMTVGSPPDGGNQKVERITDFDIDGGVAIVEPDTASEERVEYRTINEATDELVGLTRPNPKAHSSGVFVQEGEEPTVEKWVDGKTDDDEELSFIPVPASLYPLLRVGSYDEDTAPAIVIEYDDDADQLVVEEGPVGAVPSFDDDLEVLPPVGGGDASLSVLDPFTGKFLPPKGMGFEDGAPPEGSITPIVTGGIGNLLFVRIPTLANSSIVKYQVHVHTTPDFTPGPGSLYSVVDLAGTPGFDALEVIKDFPADHDLDGTAADPPKAGTNYEVCIVPADGSGETPGPYPRVTATPTDISADLIGANAITQTKISDGAISTPKLAANAVTAAKIAALAITAAEIAANAIIGDKIAGSTITANKLSVSTLSAITADLGTVIAGSMTAVTIRSAFGDNYVQMSAGLAQVIDFIQGGSLRGSLSADSDGVIMRHANNVLTPNIKARSADNLFAFPLAYSNTNDVVSNPGVSAGSGQALPGNPAVWFKLFTPAGGSRWFPTW